MSAVPGHRTRLAAVVGLAATVAIALVAASCTLETGGSDSTVSGDINAPNCYDGDFNLNPDYFAAVPFVLDDSLQIRIQNGGDFQSFSDGLFILVDKVTVARAQLAASTEVPKAVTLSVSLPPEVTPPGVPIIPTATPSRVHMGLYLQRSCRTQNVALYALDQVTLGANGKCSGAGAPQPACSGAVTGDAGVADAGEPAIGRSTITFYRLFSGDPDEPSADERYTKADFDVYLADPREACPGGLGPPPPCRGHLKGKFDFYFQRGRPAQPFP